MNLPKCYHCQSQPCECADIKVTLKRLILGELTQHGRMNDEQIMAAIETMYRRAGTKCPFEHVDGAMDSLIYGRRVKRTEGKWEGEYWYRIRKKPAHQQQKDLFA